MLINFKYKDQGFTPKINYVLDFLENHPLSPNGTHFLINEGDEKRRQEKI